MYNEYEVRPMPLSVPHIRRQVEAFLEVHGLRLDAVDYYACVFRLGDEDEILAGGGLDGNIIKCIAVNEKLREEGFSSRLVSHLISEANAIGYTSMKAFTKPENRDIFESMGFHTIAKAEKAILLDNSNGLAHYCQYLSSKKRDGRGGIIVMNANPFTQGHRYLIEQSAREVDTLYIIVVAEERSFFTYDERKKMIEAGTEDIPNVVVCDGSDYIISQATFPTYFLKELTYATDTQIELDIDLYLHHIAPALGAIIRFVGSEPSDPLTARYNSLMHKLLNEHNHRLVEIERLNYISASVLRNYLLSGNFKEACRLAYPSTVPYLFSALATYALQQELDTTPKPGLVDRHDSGAHQDMDYTTMRMSLQSIRPHFALLKHSFCHSKRYLLETERTAFTAMKQASNGVNTHKGAFFCIGITILAAQKALAENGIITPEALQENIKGIASLLSQEENTHGGEVKKHAKVNGALDNALSGYTQLFNSWLPYYNSLDSDKWQNHKTLLLIMSEIDDTNIYYRKGSEVAKHVKEEAKALLDDFNTDELWQMNDRFNKENISPGGAADMLALTIFIDKLLQKPIQ